jgi:hypothetical protein
MIYLYNLIGFILCLVWNACMLIGTVYLIDFYNWSHWWLVFTLCIFMRWKEWTPKEPEPEEPSKIIL